MFAWTEVTNPLQIMYSVSQGHRPDTSEESLPLDIPHRALMVSLIEGGWAQNPDERPSFLSEYATAGWSAGLRPAERAVNNIVVGRLRRLEDSWLQSSPLWSFVALLTG